MLPFGGQAANQALEDSGALGALFHDSNITTNEIPARLKLFEKVRRNRASTIQMLSSTRVGQEPTVEAILWNYAEPGAAGERRPRVHRAIAEISIRETKFY